MAQLSSHPDTIPSRPYEPPRGGSRFAGVRDLWAGLDWRRTYQLYRRLLSGDLSVMREVSIRESDNTPTLIVLVLGILAASLGSWLFVLIDTRAAAIGGSALDVLLIGSIATLGAWGIWIGVSWHALRSLFATEVAPRALMRAFAVSGGFAVWQFWLFAGPVSFAVGLVGTLASVVLAFIALRAAAPEADDRAALGSVGIGFAAYALTLSIVAQLAGVGSGIFVHALV